MEEYNVEITYHIVLLFAHVWCVSMSDVDHLTDPTLYDCLERRICDGKVFPPETYKYKYLKKFSKHIYMYIYAFSVLQGMCQL